MRPKNSGGRKKTEGKADAGVTPAGFYWREAYATIRIKRSRDEMLGLEGLESFLVVLAVFRIQTILGHEFI